MSSNLIHKRSSVQGKIPLPTSLSYGEIALNTFDGNIYMKHNSGTGNNVVSFSNDLSLSITESQISNLKPYLVNITGQNITDLSDVLSSMSPANNDILAFNSVNGWQSSTINSIVNTEPIKMLTNTINTNITILSGLNGFSVGPIEISNGIIINIAMYSVWIII